MQRRSTVVLVLGTTQTLAWASSYYLVAILAAPMAREFGVREPSIFAAFSAAMIASALIGPWSGRLIDRHGGRPVLVGTNLLFALGLGALASARGMPTMLAAWVLMGVAMGSGLYEAAFATLVRLYGQQSRAAITGITLIAGFASTVGWPLSAWMEAHYGWRGACVGWLVLHLVVGLPLNAWLPRAAPAGPRKVGAPVQAASQAGQGRPAGKPAQDPLRAAVLLASVFAAAWFVSTAMAAHFPRVIQASGASLAAAVAVGALIGPAQVGARLLEFGLLRRFHPLVTARLATLAHPLGVLALLVGGSALAPAFGILHGAGNGIMTIAMATLPLAVFGAQGYGARQGWLMLPARIMQSLSPFLFGLALDRWAVHALLCTAALNLLAFGALALLRPGTATD